MVKGAAGPKLGMPGGAPGPTIIFGPACLLRGSMAGCIAGMAFCGGTLAARCGLARGSCRTLSLS
eukprot:7396793-Prorocentrum_lima.AAC.1